MQHFPGSVANLPIGPYLLAPILGHCPREIQTEMGSILLIAAEIGLEMKHALISR